MLNLKQSLKSSTKRSLFFGIFIILMSSSVWSHDGCPHSLVVESSGRDHDLFPTYQEDAKHITEVAQKLGIAVPPKHHLTFVPSTELGEMSAIGHYPLPFWQDGLSVYQSRSQISGVMEFVTAGESVHRSFYSDTSTYWDQLSIIMHVMGHNDFAINSAYKAMSKSDPMATSLRLGEKIRHLYTTYDHNNVSLYVQWLYSLQYLQDFVDGSFEEPSKFKPKSKTTADLVGLKKKHWQQNTPSKAEEIPWETTSVLSALSATYPEDGDEWKREILSDFLNMVDAYPGSVQTKIMNEGWATFCQFLILRHSKWADQEDAFIELAELFRAVLPNHAGTQQKISNPYWLGFNAWKHYHEQYLAKEENQGRDAVEVDQEFVEMAHEIMLSDGNFEFLRETLDDKWVTKQKYFLFREALPEEIQKYCEGKGQECYPGQGEKAIIVLSRNAERIVNYIARKQADRSFIFPQIKMKQRHQRGGRQIYLEHNVLNGIPLKLDSAVQTLFVISQIMEATATIKTIVYPNLRQNDLTSYPIEISVSPNGELSLDGDEAVLNLTPYLEKALEHYLLDLEQTETKAQTKTRKQRFVEKVASDVANRMLAPWKREVPGMVPGKFLNKSISSGEAILEFKKMLDWRMAKRISMAVKGQIGHKQGSNSVRLRIMPLIPNFELNTGVLNILQSNLPPAPVDTPSSLPTQKYKMGQDDRTMLESHPNFLPGDIVKIKSPPPGQGQGQPQDGESEDAEEDEDGEPTPIPGEGGQDPSDVELDMDEWGKALYEELGLPNIRRLQKGRSDDKDEIYNGKIKRDHGRIIWPKTVPAALKYPIAKELLKENGEFDLGDIIDMLIEGMPQIGPEDYVVKNRAIIDIPTHKAVMVMVMDFSGSMQGLPHQMARQLVFNLKAMLSSQYKEMEFKFVVYDTEARLFEEDQVFGRNPEFLGGGTSNEAGFLFAEKVLAQYPYREWNKYLIGIGDAGAPDGPQVVKILNRIYSQVQHISYVYTDGGMGWKDESFLQSIQGFTNSKEWAEYAEMKGANQKEVIRVLKELYPANAKH